MGESVDREQLAEAVAELRLYCEHHYLAQENRYYLTPRIRLILRALEEQEEALLQRGGLLRKAHFLLSNIDIDSEPFRQEIERLLLPVPSEETGK